MRSFQFSKNSAFHPPASRSPYSGGFPVPQMSSNSGYFQQMAPHFYRGISPNVDMPMMYGPNNGVGSAFLQRAQAVNSNHFPAQAYEGNQLFESPSPLIIQRQVPVNRMSMVQTPQQQQHSQTTATASNSVKAVNQHPSLLVSAARQQLIEGASASSSSDGDEFTTSKADEINDYSDDISKGQQSTNVSGAPSPQLPDKPLISKQQENVQNLLAEEMAT